MWNAVQFISHPGVRRQSLKRRERLGVDDVASTVAYHQLSKDSYDRLFPSQDTMPRGGFGRT